MKVSLGTNMEIWDFTPYEREIMFDDLTLPNPVYEQAMRHTPYGYTTIPKYLFYAQATEGLMSVPRGYPIPFPYEVKEDKRFTLRDKNCISWPKAKFELRKTQQEALETYIEKRQEAINNKRNVDGVIVLPTGKGKSILGIAIAAKLKQRVLVIVWKDDLVTGWMNDIYDYRGIKPKNVGLIKAKDYRLGKQVTITTIQTLSKLPPEKLQFLREYFSMIIVDEFHHSASKIYEVVDTFPALDRIGLTATDMRNDKLDRVLNFYFGNCCYRFEETDDDEDIIAPKDVHIKIKNSNIFYNPPDNYLWNDGMHRGLVGDLWVYDKDADEEICLKNQSADWKKEIKNMVDKGKVRRKPMNPHNMYNAIDSDFVFNKMVAQDILFEYTQGKSCLAFCKEKEHVRILASLVKKAGVPEDQIQLYYGDMKKAKNAKEIMKRKAESKEVLVTIATYSIATEGTNVKAWERCFLAMTFNNPISTIQAIGRVRRKKEGKQIAVVYDYRHPNIKGARNHGATRDSVYAEKGFTVEGKSKKPIQQPLFTRGFGN